MDPLSQDQLAAFAAVVRAGSFTRAARELHLTQPALSRRIAGLEERLATALVVRGPRQLTLTEAGRRLLGFVQAQRALEDELLAELAPRHGEHRGTIRICGMSSVVPDVIVPALAPFLLAHPAVQLDLLDGYTRVLFVVTNLGDLGYDPDVPQSGNGFFAMHFASGGR